MEDFARNGACLCPWAENVNALSILETSTPVGKPVLTFPDHALECARNVPPECLSMKIVDLIRELYHRTPSYPGHPPIIHGMWKDHADSLADSGNVWGLSSMFISMADHGGTHIDAP